MTIIIRYSPCVGTDHHGLVDVPDMREDETGNYVRLADYQELAALAARSPAVAGDGLLVGDVPAMAHAWLAVTGLLHEIAPDWVNNDPVGREAALAAIRRLATTEQPGSSVAQGRMTPYMARQWLDEQLADRDESLSSEVYEAIVSQLVTTPPPAPAAERRMIEAPPVPVFYDEPSCAWAAGWECSYKAHAAEQPATINPPPVDSRLIDDATCLSVIRAVLNDPFYGAEGSATPERIQRTRAALTAALRQEEG